MHWITFIWDLYVTNVVDGRRRELLESSRERRWTGILGIAFISLELDSILNLDILVIKSRDWTLNKQQVFRRIHLHDLFPCWSENHFIVLYFFYLLWGFAQWHCFHPYDQPSFYPWTLCLATRINYPYQPNVYVYTIMMLYLALTRWTSRTMRQWMTVRCWLTSKIPSLHDTSKTFTNPAYTRMNITTSIHPKFYLRRCSDIHVLTRNKVRCFKFSTQRKDGIFGNTEFSKLLTQTDTQLFEMLY